MSLRRRIPQFADQWTQYSCEKVLIVPPSDCSGLARLRKVRRVARKGNHPPWFESAEHRDGPEGILRVGLDWVQTEKILDQHVGSVACNAGGTAMRQRLVLCSPNWHRNSVQCEFAGCAWEAWIGGGPTRVPASLTLPGNRSVFTSKRCLGLSMISVSNGR